MKKLKYITLILGLLIFANSCEEDLLERYPGDAMSEETFFNKASDFESYVNGLYGYITRNVMNNRWQSLENGSDNLVTPSPAGVLMQHGTSGEAPLTSNTWNNAYNYIRQVNYLLENAEKADPDDLIAQHFIGEAYYCRAYSYFTLLENFGEVPYIDKVLNTDSEELYKQRESRDFIAGKIIEDLDQAINRLHWKGEGRAVAARVNKETALVLKSRVALFEGSWEYYHGRKNTPFKVDGNDGSAFLDKAIEAGDALIARHGASIFVGRAGFEYEDLFNKEDYENIAGAFFYKHFDAALDVTHLYRSAPHGEGVSITKSAVDEYLMTDGKPEVVSSVTYDYTNQSSLLHARDPRLAQTIYAPDRGGIKDYLGGFSIEQFWNVIYPDLNHSFYANPGGYRVIKGIPLTTISIDINESDDLIMRYAEALLNYAEAKAIKGNITQQDIDNTINVLRGRVGMVPMNVGEVNGWSIEYSESKGYDPSASNILNEIRRERRVELMFEGFRRTDIMRWALMAEVFNGHKPQGAYYQELFAYWNDTDTLAKAGMPPAMIEDRALVEGVNIGRLGDYINPFWRNADFTETGRGYYVDPERDYLQAIPKEEINLYEEKAGVTLTQNPGWF
jgi:starch-binding outer membrane protein, SusD/RagB family